jgi:hypothetical protein
MEGDDWGVRRKQGPLAGQTTHNAVLFAEERPHQYNPAVAEGSPESQTPLCRWL